VISVRNSEKRGWEKAIHAFWSSLALTLLEEPTKTTGFFGNRNESKVVDGVI
jgi:hypothetical protein